MLDQGIKGKEIMMVQQQNYISRLDFAKFLDVMPRLPIYHMDLQKPSVTPKELQMIAKIQYGCALRIGEVLSIHAEDFNLQTKIVTLRRTKTGLRKCSRCKGSGSNVIESKTNHYDDSHICLKCNGKGKIRINQFTTIPEWLNSDLKSFLQSKSGQLFKTSRQVIAEYYKSAGYMANLDIFEMQTEREIHGVWTHLLRKSYSKWMQEMGASRELRMVKLRHANKDAHDAYDRPDINAVLIFESKHSMLLFGECQRDE